MQRNYSIWDIFIIYLLVLIGSAECVNLLLVFRGRTISSVCNLFAVIAIVGIVIVTVLGIVVLGHQKTDTRFKEFSDISFWLGLMAMALLIAQICKIVLDQAPDTTGDMTLETVKSFLYTDTAYSVNPMTGRAYTAGVPNRIKILCLPTLYSVLAQLLHTAPETVVWKIIPLLITFTSFAAFCSLGKALFPDKPEKQLFFLIVVEIILLIGFYTRGMDGYALRLSGFKGTTIRNLVLIPYALSLGMRRRFLPAILCVIAEACIVWTLYGAGMSLLVFAGVIVAGFIIGGSTVGRRRNG